MSRPTDKDPPPDSTDLEGWRRAVNDGHHKRYRLEAIVAAIQDLGPCTDKAVLNPLAKHLSDALLHILRKLVSVNHPNRGVDLIERTHGQIIDAILQPECADGKALRLAFVPRVTFRLKDALTADANAARNRERHEAEVRAGRATQRGTDGAAHDVPRKNEAPSELDECLDVGHILEQVTDDQKRLAFRLFMDGVPFKSKKAASIAEALGISEKTAREWVNEVQELLSSVPAAQELLKSKTRGSK
jgi:alcohol dehydrogenase class IV